MNVGIAEDALFGAIKDWLARGMKEQDKGPIRALALAYAKAKKKARDRRDRWKMKKRVNQSGFLKAGKGARNANVSDTVERGSASQEAPDNRVLADIRT